MRLRLRLRGRGRHLCSLLFGEGRADGADTRRTHGGEGEQRAGLREVARRVSTPVGVRPHHLITSPPDYLTRRCLCLCRLLPPPPS